MGSEAAERHRRAAAGATAICAVLTVSDTRTADDDPSGDLIVERLSACGHEICDRRWVQDEPNDIGRELSRWLVDGRVQVIITTGGTGIGPRDTTVDVVERFLDTRLDGFGEIFRVLSYEQVGSAAMLSRAVAGLARGVVVFALPGSRAAVELALDRLIVPELPHLVVEKERVTS
jgi:molybdenum cofactor biosynthesis protein B